MIATASNATARNLEPLIWGEYNVRHYGAAGNKTAANKAIADLNAAGGGTLVFPFGTFDTTGYDPITVPCTVTGHGTGFYHDDGAGGYLYSGLAPTLIRNSSATADTFTFTGPYATVKALNAQCTAATPTAGAAFRCAGDGTANAKASRYEFQCVTIIDGYYGIEHANGAYSVFDRVNCSGQRKYGLWLRNDANADWGDSRVAGCTFTANESHGTEAAIRYESGGGLKVLGNKFVGPNITHGLWGHFDTGCNTTQLYVIGNSFDGLGGNGVRLETAGTGTFGHVFIHDNYLTTHAEPVYLNAGGAFGSLLNVTVDDCHLIGGDVTKPLFTLTGSGGIGVTLGVYHPGGSYSQLYVKGATDRVIGGWYDSGDGIFTSPGAIGVAGANAAVVIRGQNGDPGYSLRSPSTAGGFRIYDANNATDVLTLDSGKNLTLVAKLNATGVNLGNGYGTSAGQVGNIKLDVYNDGTSRYGLGISPGLLEEHVPAASDRALYVGGALKFKVGASGVGFNGSAAMAKPTITGSRGGNAAVASLLTQLANYGLITDGTTA
jgi:hypothetical protein